MRNVGGKLITGDSPPPEITRHWSTVSRSQGTAQWLISAFVQVKIFSFLASSRFNYALRGFVLRALEGDVRALQHLSVSFEPRCVVYVKLWRVQEATTFTALMVLEEKSSQVDLPVNINNILLAGRGD